MNYIQRIYSDNSGSELLLSRLGELGDESDGSKNKSNKSKKKKDRRLILKNANDCDYWVKELENRMMQDAGIFPLFPAAYTTEEVS